MARLRRAKAAKCPFRVIVDRGDGGRRWKWVEENDDERGERRRKRASSFAARGFAGGRDRVAHPFFALLP